MLLVTDGAVDLPDAVARSRAIRIVPGQVWVGSEPFAGGPAEFWAMLRRGAFPATTPATVSELAEAYSHSDLVIAVHVSSVLSATVARAHEAAARSANGVVVIDSRSLSAGAGLVATAVHYAMTSPTPCDSIVDLALSLPDRLHTFALVQDVAALNRSGRAGLLPKDHVERNQPLLLAVRGRALPLEQPKDRANALRRLVVHLDHVVGRAPAAWALAHGDAADALEAVDRIAQALGSKPAFVTQLDPTVGVHTGPDALVVGVLTGATRAWWCAS